MSRYRFPFHKSERESESRLKRAEDFLSEWVAVGNSEKNRKKLLSKLKRITLYSHHTPFLQTLVKVIPKTDTRMLAVLLETLQPFSLEDLEGELEKLSAALLEAMQESIDPFRSAMILQYMMHKNYKQNETMRTFTEDVLVSSKENMRSSSTFQNTFFRTVCIMRISTEDVGKPDVVRHLLSHAVGHDGVSSRVAMTRLLEVLRNESNALGWVLPYLSSFGGEEARSGELTFNLSEVLSSSYLVDICDTIIHNDIASGRSNADGKISASTELCIEVVGKIMTTSGMSQIARCVDTLSGIGYKTFQHISKVQGPEVVPGTLAKIATLIASGKRPYATRGFRSLLSFSRCFALHRISSPRAESIFEEDEDDTDDDPMKEYGEYVAVGVKSACPNVRVWATCVEMWRCTRGAGELTRWASLWKTRETKGWTTFHWNVLLKEMCILAENDRRSRLVLDSVVHRFVEKNTSNLNPALLCRFWTCVPPTPETLIKLSIDLIFKTFANDVRCISHHMICFVGNSVGTEYRSFRDAQVRPSEQNMLLPTPSTGSTGSGGSATKVIPPRGVPSTQLGDLEIKDPFLCDIVGLLERKVISSDVLTIAMCARALTRIAFRSDDIIRLHVLKFFMSLGIMNTAGAVSGYLTLLQDYFEVQSKLEKLKSLERHELASLHCSLSRFFHAMEELMGHDGMDGLPNWAQLSLMMKSLQT